MRVIKLYKGGSSDLACRYGVDAEILANVLRFNAAPILREDEDGNLIGSWPKNLPIP